MTSLWLQIELLSDTTFGSGEGVPGLVDVETQFDADGLPFCGGRELKGLLAEAGGNLLPYVAPDWATVHGRLFGMPGSSDARQSSMNVDSARLPEDLQRLLHDEVARERVTRQELIEAFSEVRRQSSTDSVTGGPEEGSLRASRTLCRGLKLQATIEFYSPPPPEERTWLAVCALAVRNAGTSRNRGRGRTRLSLLENGRDISVSEFNNFRPKEAEQCG